MPLHSQDRWPASYFLASFLVLISLPDSPSTFMTGRCPFRQPIVGMGDEPVPKDHGGLFNPMRNQLFTLALSGALALGIASPAFAQDNTTQPQSQQEYGQGRGPMRMNPDRQLEHMTRELGLSADQQSQIKPLLVDRQQKMEALFQDQSVSNQDRRARMHSIRQDSQSKIEALLNDQQKQKFEAMQQERGRRGWQGGGQQGAAQPQ
jgi:periplasmic protein CpxP/Spy